MPRFEEAQLNQVAEIIGRGITPKYTDSSGIQVVNQRCIRNGTVDLSLARVHDESKRSVREDKILINGDVVVCSTGVGTLGRTAGIRNLNTKVTADSHVTIVRPRGNVDPDWLAYSMQYWEPVIEGMAQGSTGQTELSRLDLGLLRLQRPPHGVQVKIGEVLRMIDDKIESNQAKISSIPELIESSVKRVLTNESENVPVSSLADFINGGAYTKGASGSGRMVLRIAELNSGPGASTIYSDLETPFEKTAYPGDVLMSWSGSLGVYRWTLSDALINQHIFKVIPHDFPQWLIYDRLRSAMPIFQGIAADKATTMGHIKRHHLDDVTIQIPSNQQIEELETICNPLWDVWLNLANQNEVLKQLRDSLLPELLSGRIDPNEIGNIVRSSEIPQ